MDADVHAAFVALQNELTVTVSSPILQAIAAQTKAQADNTAAIIAAIKAQPAGSAGALTDAQAGELSGILQILTKIEQSLKAA